MVLPGKNYVIIMPKDSPECSCSSTPQTPQQSNASQHLQFSQKLHPLCMNMD